MRISFAGGPIQMRQTSSGTATTTVLSTVGAARPTSGLNRPDTAAFMAARSVLPGSTYGTDSICTAFTEQYLPINGRLLKLCGILDSSIDIYIDLSVHYVFAVLIIGVQNFVADVQQAGLNECPSIRWRQ
jgi:hypothetical protein